jgi:hypothetical protein
MGLRQRIEIIEKPKSWLNEMATRYHYLRRPVHHRACPFGWAVVFDGELFQSDGLPSGFIIFASIHYTRLTGEFGYPGQPTKWQVLSLARLWLHDDLPRNSETCVIGKCLAQKGHERMALVQKRWLEVHPPRFPKEPYHIRKIISYADTTYHNGSIYRAANFREYRRRVISQRRHKNTRGNGADGAELICYIYDMDKPKMAWNPLMGLPLGELA